MITIRLFKSHDCTCQNLTESHIYGDRISAFENLFINKQMFNLDVEVYKDDNLIFVGVVGHFLFRLIDEFRDDIDKEMK